MLKRITKVTSLLVVAASIVSMVPAMAVDVKKISADEAIVYQGISIGDGTFYLDAELNDKDEAIYLYANGKFAKVDGAEAGDKINGLVTYNDKKYLEMDDGDYYVDLKTGEITHEDILGDIDDDAELAVRKAIKANNDGRFDKTYYDEVVKAEYDHGTCKTMFGPTGVWRKFYYKLNMADLYGDQYSAVYSDDKGNYIDADYNLGKIGIYSTGAAITIKNTESTYELKGTDGQTYEIKATISNDTPKDEELESITRTAELSIWGRVKNSGDDYENITDQVYFGSKSNHHKQTVINGSGDNKSVTVIQKISKAQSSDDIDGIKYSKDVSTYFITDEDGAAVHLLGLSDTSNTNVDGSGYGTISSGPQGYMLSSYCSSAKLKQYAETINFKSENGYYYIDVSDSDSVSIDSLDESVIGFGDLFDLSSDGYVEMFNGKDSSFEKLYKVDGGMNKISVSLPSEVIVWNKDDGIYSIITSKASTLDKTATTNTKTTAGETASTVVSGWSKEANGAWTYVKTDGTKATGWFQDGSTWYYLKEDGIMTTGWQNIKGNWYYLNSSGAMQTGWINDKGIWYYCNEFGVMLADTTVDGYKVGSNGTWIQ
ncbi:N-acetylmuramoyl-L-alanine amidase family protein [Clostridium saccharoperbutylacetonicum]|uniref:N-acetylmuramoyl-L-alanine amidase family protein n=1 Tax=Clostridium saccharoperbutylacetonicum TaxID=36745 RepID=UPI000983F640|nr:N-acetylmuramoyl-L-alanine amidase family protein [Clostridium saccharoperbutylacetonicum]AQR98186.1 putative endo-beta-N-acetylglucosaminidase precursor [Clostridium saccharoperbutylacetonicum]NSB34080.1 hypothetical protein [Clostridium saccharoperbutylacetonicum]